MNCILNLFDDLVFVFVVKDVCIEVLIFGKLLIGIEVFNLEIVMVFFCEFWE